MLAIADELRNIHNELVEIRGPPVTRFGGNP
jgi:hypothetical protein